MCGGGGGLVGGRVDGVVLVTEKVVVKLWDNDEAVVVRQVDEVVDVCTVTVVGDSSGEIRGALGVAMALMILSTVL